MGMNPVVAAVLALVDVKSVKTKVEEIWQEDPMGGPRVNQAVAEEP